MEIIKIIFIRAVQLIPKFVGWDIAITVLSPIFLVAVTTSSKNYSGKTQNSSFQQGWKVYILIGHNPLPIPTNFCWKVKLSTRWWKAV